MRKGPGLRVRLTAVKEEVLFVDRVNHREVWLFRADDGTEWMAQARLGQWVRRTPKRPSIVR